MLGHELQNRVEHGCPSGDLLSCVVYARDRVTAVTERGTLLVLLPVNFVIRSTGISGVRKSYI